MGQRNKRYLVVDACVIGYTSHDPNDDGTWKAVEILSKIKNVSHIIVLDIAQLNEESILDEYKRQAKSELAKRWLIAMQTTSGKIEYRYRAPVHFSVLSDPDDEKYLQVAMNSPHKIIISEDSDLTSISNETEVTSKGIMIWGFDVARTEL